MPNKTYAPHVCGALPSHAARYAQHGVLQTTAAAPAVGGQAEAWHGVWWEWCQLRTRGAKGTNIQ